MTLPIVALSIMQPWSWLIVNGHKDIENRNWRRRFPERVLVHAGLKVDTDASSTLIGGFHPVTGQKDDELAIAYIQACKSGKVHLGGIVGAVDILGCYDGHDSPWFVGAYGYELAKAQVLPFKPVKGQLGFFACDYDKLEAA